jgi:nucleosome binding factor SPN SPT16 subunit
VRATAKILAQVQGSDNPIPVEVLVLEKGKDAPSTALPALVQHYTSHARVGHLAKDANSGKLMDEWHAAVDAANARPELVDMSPALAAVMAVKDEEELVRARLLL